MDKHTKGEKAHQLPQSHAAFVTFSTIQKAAQCNQSRLTHVPGRWHTAPAPEPEDVKWSTLHRRRISLFLRGILVNIAVILLVFFWAIPLTFVSALANLDALAQALPFLEPILNISPVIAGFIQGFAPALLIIIFLALIPVILRALGTVQGFYTHSDVAVSVLNRYFFFLMVNVFFVTLIATSVFGVIGQFADLVKSPGDVFNLLATSLPRQSNFFINYVMVASWISYGLFMWRPVDILLGMLKKKFLAKSKRDFRVIDAPLNFYHPNQIARELIVFVIITVYSTISPLILPFGLAYFLLAFITTKYNLMYVYEARWESGGKLWPSIFNKMMVALVIYLLTLIGVFGLYRFIAGVAVGGALIVLTLLYWVWIHARFDRVAKYGTLEHRVGEAEIEDRFKKGNVDPIHFIKADYVHPVLHSLERPENQAVTDDEVRREHLRQEGKGLSIDEDVIDLEKNAVPHKMETK